MERDDQVGGGAPARGDLLSGAQGGPEARGDLPGGQGAPPARTGETTVYAAGGSAPAQPVPGAPEHGGPAYGDPAPGGPASGPPLGGAASAGPAPGARSDEQREEERIARERVAPGSVRAEDTEPYIGLQYIARLFKIVSFLVLIALGLEMLLGVASDGASAILPLFAEIVQGGVLAAILWGAADVVLLLIDLGHDVRAERVLLGRISARGEQQYGGGQRKRERER